MANTVGNLMSVIPLDGWAGSFAIYDQVNQHIVPEILFIQASHCDGIWANPNLHQLHIAVWVHRGDLREINQRVRGSRDNVQRPQGQPAPDRTTRHGMHLEPSDDAKVVAAPLEAAE